MGYKINLREEEVGASDSFQSHFMSDFIRGRLGEESGALFDDQELHPASYPQGNTPITFSPEAQHLLEAGRKLWRYYHSQPDADPNASYYDIREYFQGRNEQGKMNTTSEDVTYTNLLKNLNQARSYLGTHKIAPKAYLYGYLHGDTRSLQRGGDAPDSNTPL